MIFPSGFAKNWMYSYAASILIPSPVISGTVGCSETITCAAGAGWRRKAVNANTRATVAALENNPVDILAHPDFSSRSISSR